MRTTIKTLAAFFVLTAALLAEAQTANSNGIYQQLRTVTVGTEAIAVDNVRLKRDTGLFTFRTGNIYFLAPVNGKVTGAVFIGDGSFVLEPANTGERRSISLLTKEQFIQETFATAVFRFTDNTYDELKKLGTAAAQKSGNPAQALSSIQDTLRNSREIRYNLTAHLLPDVLSEEAVPGVFYSFINGKRFSNKELFIVDPQGVSMLGMAPEEVVFATYDESGANAAQSAMEPSIWYSSHLLTEIDNHKASGTQRNALYDVQKQKLDASFEKNGHMYVTAFTTITPLRSGLRALSFNLFRNFKIQSVTDPAGQPLDFVFEEGSFSRYQGDDPDAFTIILPKSLPLGEPYTFKSVYDGKEAVTNEGGGNYYPVARDNWFPAGRLGDTADFEMKFTLPKGMKIVATGTMLSETNDGDHSISEWRSDVPMWVAGFNFGRFKMMEAKLTDGTVVRSYANESQPDWVHGLQVAAEESREVALGTMDTTSMMKRPLGEGQDAMQIYNSFFGPTPYKLLQLSQQPPCTYGQAWPGLVWLPICSFYDGTVRHQLGLDDTGEAYWDVVTPHEVAHQWWGHTVGWTSYRDQWMSEGFAEFSASLFTQAVYAKNVNKYLKFWSDRQRNLQMKNQFGFRYCDVAPLNLGLRLNNARSGFSTYRRIVYPKGAFVLHMLRMMMYDRKNGDAAFKDMMHDFVKTYSNKSASTEDFKAMVEKHMLPVMDLEGNHNMDWFFNEWVYGTELPKYSFSYTTQDTPEGLVLDLKLSQDGVSPTFAMPVPLYAELANGAVVKLGTLKMVGTTVSQNKVSLGKGPAPKRFMVNYYYDVLSQDR